MHAQWGLFDTLPPQQHASPEAFADELAGFVYAGKTTAVSTTHATDATGHAIAVRTYVNEFWTSQQRAGNGLHEVSYRACFKPQLPRFFIERLTQAGDIVYDPFMGRGTTLIEAALMGRRPYGCDVNPLSAVLGEPRLRPPALDDVRRGLAAVDFTQAGEMPEELLLFYHPDTLRQISALRRHLLDRDRDGTLSEVDRWIRMVAVSRLAGHSPGFFSVRTMPPNQAVSARKQAELNARHDQRPKPKDVPGIIVSKSRSLLRHVTPALREQLAGLADRARLLTGLSSSTPGIATDSVALVVTSPPFLDVVDYKGDNWLRCWFSGIDASTVPITVAKQVDAWQAFVTTTLVEVRRILRPGGHVAFEVGEVRGGAVRLEDVVVPAGIAAGLEPVLVLVNAQAFTKTANCWGVTNNRKGTNTNRIVLLRKAA